MTVLYDENFILDRTVRVPNGKTLDEWDSYEAEVGTVSKAFLGFDPDHNQFSLMIEIEEDHRDYTRSTGYRSLPTTAYGAALLQRVIKVVGGEYSSLNGLVGQPAILLRDESHWTPVGVASPVTGKICFFDKDYSKEAGEVA